MAIISNVENRHIQKLEIEDNIFDGEKVVGSFVKNLGKIQLINIDKQYETLKGQEIDIENFGTWYVNDIRPIQERINIELDLFDLGYRFDTEYVDDIEFPISIINWAKKICERRNIEFASVDFPNADFIMETKPFTKVGATDRDVLKMIAEACGCFAKIQGNKFYIKWFEDTVINIEDWFSLKQGKQTERVNVVVLGRGDVESNIYFPTILPENPFELRIDNNQIQYFNREALIEPIYSQSVGFNFFPIEMSTFGQLILKSGLKVHYNDIDGTEIETYIMNHKLTYLGGNYNNPENWKSDIGSFELKETTTKFQFAGTIEKRINNAEITVDKQGNQILSLVETTTTIQSEVDENTQSIINNTTLITQKSDSISTTVSQTGGLNRLENTQWYLDLLKWIFKTINLFNINSEDKYINAMYGELSNIQNGFRNTITTVHNAQRIEIRIPNIFEENKNYVSSCKSNPLFSRNYIYELNTLTGALGNNISQTGVFTKPTTPYVAILFYAPVNSAIGTNFDIWDIQIEEGEKPTSYVPFTEIIFTTEFDTRFLSRRILNLSNGGLLQEFRTENGQEYTISFQYSKQQMLQNISYVRLYTNPTEYKDLINTFDETTNMTRFSYTWIATTNNYKLEIYTNNSLFRIADLIVQSGTSTIWSPNALETIGINHLLDVNGLQMYKIENMNNNSQLDDANLLFKEDGIEKSHYGIESSKNDITEANRRISLGNLDMVRHTNDIYGIG